MAQFALLALVGVFAGVLVSFPIFLPTVHTSIAINATLRRSFALCAALIACGLVFNHGNLLANELRANAADCSTPLGRVACASTENALSMRSEIGLRTLLPPSADPMCISGNQAVCDAVTTHITDNVAIYARGWEHYLQGIIAGLLAGFGSGWLVWTISCSLAHATQQRLAVSSH